LKERGIKVEDSSRGEVDRHSPSKLKSIQPTIIAG